MYKTVNFKKKILATVVASTAMAGFSGFAAAQSSENIDEVVITGIKASLTRSMDIKRDAVGVVDAISAEDIGKMPDSNLAESLQRITGVSIDRANGEGRTVTVRGFGPDYNLVTLNGRAMPSSDFDSRSFDFGALASEGVSGLEVFKTGRANIASGGIGATINIKTTRPLDTPGLKTSIGIKAVNDSTNRTGDDLTPEISGLFSDTFADDTFGVALTASYQKRDSGQAGATSQQWNTSAYHAADFAKNTGALIENAPAEGQLYSTPIDYRFELGDQERERTNGQLTLQYKPTDRLKATLDYTYSENKWTQSRIEQSLWFVSARSHVVFDNETVKTPVLMTETISDPKDISFARQFNGSTEKNNAIGINLSFDVTDNLNLTLDYNDAKSKTVPPSSRGTFNASVAANVVKTQTIDWSKKFPIMSITVDDTVHGNGNGVLDAGDMTTTMGQAFYTWVTDDIKQLRLDGTFKFEESSLQFGVESRKNEYLGQDRGGPDGPIYMGDWGGANAADVPDTFWHPRNFVKDFKGYSLGNSFTGGMDWNFEEVTQWAATQVGVNPLFHNFPGGIYQAGSTPGTYRGINEDVQAVYVQYNLPGELAEMPYHLLAGVRYEKTDVTASTQARNPSRIRWTGDDDFQTDVAAAATNFSRDASYNNVLPSLDFDIEFVKDLKGRFSVSKTIARPTYGNMKADVSTTDFRSYEASAGNPGLLPYESRNIDLSLEWYYDTSSYVSVGAYSKKVDNFISTQAVKGTLFDLRDVTKGPRAIAARQQVIAAGNSNPMPQDIYNQVLANQGDTGPNGNVLPDANDPLAVWNINQPINNKSAKIYGFEVAVQHMFGESGFGTQANYTTVNGDVSFDNNKINVPQFALVGLSDTANVVGFYDKNGLQVRITYNWRDEFLNNANRYNNEPEYTEAFGSVDANISYDITDNLTVSLEGLNLTGTDKRTHGRTDVQLWNLDILGPRYTIGARYTF